MLVVGMLSAGKWVAVLSNRCDVCTSNFEAYQSSITGRQSDAETSAGEISVLGFDDV